MKAKAFFFKQNLYKKKYFIQKIKLDIKLKNKKDWFDIYAKVQFGEHFIPFIKLRKHILNHDREYILPTGEIAILPEEWFSKYIGIFTMCNEIMGEMRLDKHHFSIIDDEIKGIDSSFLEDYRKLSEPSQLKTINLPTEINAKLRTYQHDGFSWLCSLQDNNFGGCLADDMGLGKTLQTLSIVQKTINDAKKNPVKKKTEQPTKKKIVQLNLFNITDEISQEDKIEQNQTNNVPACLIILPTSLVLNWENEISKFTPKLKVNKYTGNQRNKLFPKVELFDNSDIILTSYGVIRNDIDKLKEYNFLYIVLDESQYIKNPHSKTYDAVSNLNSKYKLVLTGTPIENSLTDLWAQLNFVNPGILGDLTFFKYHFVTPIEKSNNEEQKQKLQTLIRPFILRRTKQEVAKDLPDLCKQTVYIQMDENHKSLYEAEKSRVRNAIMNLIAEDELNKSALLILTGLSTLRQLANHPLLIDKNNNGSSSKFNTVIEDIESLIAEKHKVLIFSSFVKHLNIYANYFDDKGWKYSMLQGKLTQKQRMQQVDDFQNNSENRIFLISIKAGGVGLNLTAADYVFILDPWWNPAVENQAINRAHRIGQDKKVIVYRFITQDTIEEKISRLQESKLALADSFINSNNPLKGLSVESIADLFE